jgi:glutathione S-transferase
MPRPNIILSHQLEIFMALELYHNDMSTCAKKVRLVLAEKALEWKGHHMNLRAGDTRTKDYMGKLNPNGVVPTLVDNGQIICESTVIMEYLEDAYPEPPLRSSIPYEQARMRLWTKQLDEDVHAATATISSCVAFRYQMISNRSEEELKAFIDKIPNPSRRERSREAILMGIKSSYFKPAILRFEKLWSDMEKTLGDHRWLAGDNYSLADIAFTPYITRFEHLQMLGILKNRPKLANWYERIKKRPSYEEALAQWFNPNYIPLMKEKGIEAWPRVKQIISQTL